MRVLQQPAYVLINRPYSETSWIVEVFTRDYGRFSVMAKGARRLKSKLRGSLIAFQPLLISWIGKGELPTLTDAEIDRSEFSFIENQLCGDALVCGFYCNELIMKLLHRHDRHQSLFVSYHRTLMSLSRAQKRRDTSRVLREFEQSVIAESGYAVDFNRQADQGEKIDANGLYRFYAGRGFIAQTRPDSYTISGRIVLALSEQPPNDLSAQEDSQARDLMRLILTSTMNRGDIISRSLFFPRAASALETPLVPKNV